MNHMSWKDNQHVLDKKDHHTRVDRAPACHGRSSLLRKRSAHMAGEELSEGRMQRQRLRHKVLTTVTS